AGLQPPTPFEGTPLELPVFRYKRFRRSAGGPPDVSVNWTTPDDLRAQVQKLWDSGRLLADIVGEFVPRDGHRVATLPPIANSEGPEELCSPAGSARMRVGIRSATQECEPTRDSD